MQRSLGLQGDEQSQNSRFPSLTHQGTSGRWAGWKHSKPNARLWKKPQWAQSNLHFLHNHTSGCPVDSHQELNLNIALPSE